MNKVAVTNQRDHPVLKLNSLIDQLVDGVDCGEIPIEQALSGLESVIHGASMIRDFPIWKTLSTEDFFTPVEKVDTRFPESMWDRYHKKFSSPEYHIKGLELLAHGQGNYIEENQTNINLVRITPRKIGFRDTRGIRRGAFFRTVQSIGFKLGFPEIAFVLRLQYHDQPCGEWLTISAETNHTHHLDRLLRVGKAPTSDLTTDKLCVTMVAISADTIVGLDDEYIFIKSN